ncbi:ABC transporter permease [Kitasatospora sp. NPDC096147]|uniref:ABC transporter permease n=1 Tax=Kitasatospora sp. NPDC096147 TaxID=3364093 RepID=UPI00382E7EBB
MLRRWRSWLRWRGPSARVRVARLAAGLAARPRRTALTLLGPGIGVGVLVAALGWTATAEGQVRPGYDLTGATTVTVVDQPDTAGLAPGAVPPPSLPADTDARVARIAGVAAAGVWWRVGDGLRIVANPAANPAAAPAPPSGDAPTVPADQADQADSDGPVTPTDPVGPAVPAGPVGSAGSAALPGPGLTVFAASPGAVAAMAPELTAGVTLDQFAERRRLPVALLSEEAAVRLGIGPALLAAQPAVFVEGLPFTVIGVYRAVARAPETLHGLIVPTSTALERFGNPGPAGRETAKVLVATRPGAAGTVAGQLAAALRPEDPGQLAVSAPPDPYERRGPAPRRTGLLVALAVAGLCLAVGAVGLASAMLLAVVERTPEIGLLRAFGARPRQVGGRFLAEAAAVGTLAGLLGTGLGVLTVLGVALARDWTAVLPAWATLPAPLLGTAVGLLAGAHPALRAARTDPVRALRAR